MWNGVVVGVVICGLTIVVVELMMRRRRRRGEGSLLFPPGPYAWPVIGHLHLLGRNVPLHQALTEVSRGYGHIVGLRLGQRRAVVVSSPELAKQVLLTHDKLLADRPPFQFNSLLNFGPHTGVAFCRYGPQWRKNRKICFLQLFTSKRMHDLRHLRHQEIHTLLFSLHRHSLSASSSPVDLSKSMGDLSSRLILRLLHSHPSSQLGDENLQQLLREGELMIGPTMADLIPPLSFLDFFKKQRMRRIRTRLEKMYAEMLKQRREDASPHDDFIHHLLSHEENLTEKEIYGLLQEMIGAGIHSTALTIEWAMAELLRNPHCLQRLRTEIETQLGSKEQVSDADVHSLPYLKCIVMETFRLHPVLPLLVPRLSMEECKLQGYTIPAKTLVFVNVWAMGRDEGVWPNANKFLPERFEGKGIEPKGQHFELLPFGSGRRICAGLPLALCLIEVALANLVNCFDWELPNGEAYTSINMDEKTGFAANKAMPVMAIPKPRVFFSDNISTCAN